MQLIITNNFTDSNIDDFIYRYIPSFLYEQCNTYIDSAKLAKFDEIYHVNSRALLLMAVRNLIITKTDKNQYIIKTNKNIKINNQFLESYIKLITYGSRTIRGYPILYNLLELLAQNIQLVYKRYTDGYQILRPSSSR